MFPESETLARTMFEEGIRHLDDARLLHLASRYPAAVVSAMKAAKLGFKSALILEGTLGWWENVVTSHSPVKDASSHPLLRRLVTRLPGDLAAQIRTMESLAPARIGKKAFGQSQDQEEKNPEYPFIAIDPVQNTVVVIKPSESFAEDESREAFEAARALLEELASQYERIRQWNVSVTSAL